VCVDRVSVGFAGNDVADTTMIVDDVLLSGLIVAIVFGVALTWGGR
jgi:hypothetical protein